MRWSQWIGLIVVAIAVYILWRIRRILLLAFTAVILATVLDRAVRFLQRLGIRKRFLAIALVLSIVALVIVAFIIGIVPPLSAQIQELITTVPRGIGRLNDWIAAWETRFSNPFLDRLWRSIDELTRLSSPAGRQMFDRFFTVFSNTLGALAGVLLVLVLTLMLLADPARYRNAFARLFPASKRERVHEVLDRCDTAMGGWVVGILFNMSVIALLSGIGLLILGIPLALANALLAGLLTFIPNVGPTLSVIPPMAIAGLDAPWKALAVLVLYILIQQIESNLLTPLVMQKQVSLLPAITLLSQLVFAVFFGFLGLFMALPLTIVLQVLLKELIIKNWLDKS